MRLDEVLTELARRAPVPIGREVLQSLLESAEVLRESDTALAGPIRIVRLADDIVVQEQTPKGEVLLRRMPSLDSAHRLVDDRLATYERMWDGCGCKVDYYADADDAGRD